MNIFAEAARLEEQNRPFALAQIVESRGSTPRHSAQMLIREDGTIAGTIGGARIEGEGRVVFRYADNPNGSLNDIAGIVNKRGNVLGMMPHPERKIESAHGGTDGRRLPATEVLINTPMIRDLLRRGQVHEIKQAMEESLEEGMQTFDQALFRMYKDGKIDLEEALLEFAGCAMVISHDRYLVERICDSTWALFGDGTLTNLPGGIEEYLRRRKASSAKPTGAPRAAPAAPTAAPAINSAAQRAAVQAAADWGTYVAAHVYTSNGIRRAVEAGVLAEYVSV